MCSLVSTEGMGEESTCVLSAEELRKSCSRSQHQGTREARVPFSSSEPPRKSLGKLQIISKFLISLAWMLGELQRLKPTSFSPECPQIFFPTLSPMIIIITIIINSCVIIYSYMPIACQIEVHCSLSSRAGL